jgi:hypothetical protein
MRRVGGGVRVIPSHNYKVVRQALRSRQPLGFSYRGKPRVACPIVLGYAADGREALSAYQVAGETSTGHALPGWRCFYLADIRQLRSASAAWREGDSHKQPQTCVQFVDVDVNIPQTLTRPQPLPFGSPLLRPPRR